MYPEIEGQGSLTVVASTEKMYFHFYYTLAEVSKKDIQSMKDTNDLRTILNMNISIRWHHKEDHRKA